MGLNVERLSLLPDAIALARRLGARPGLVVSRARGGAESYIACDPVEERGGLDPEPELQRIPHANGETPRWFGLLPYESLRTVEGDARLDPRPLPQVHTPFWLRYDALLRVGEHVELISENVEAARRLRSHLEQARAPMPPVLSLCSPVEAGAVHAERVRRALTEIGRGNVYEVNLARRFELDVQGSLVDLLAAFERTGAMPHAFALEHAGLQVLAISPELCLRLEPDGTILTSPIKGTRPRGAQALEDARLSAELEADPKERAELTMIIDVERNDFGRVAEPGSVYLSEAPHVVALPGLFHRVASVTARIPDELSRSQLLDAVLPSGSVTGAPKRRAMQLIAELETHRRGLYTGAVGYVRHDGGLELKMAIRTLTARDGVGHYFAGGGIVADSVPAREVEETLWKAERLASLTGVALESP